MKALFFISLSCLLLSNCKQQRVFTPVDGPVSVNDTELYIKAFGQGEPLLVVHGGPGLSHDYFLPHLEALSKTNFVILYDHRAAGRSSVEQDSSSMNLETFIQDMDSIRAHFNLDKMNILAHSWGSLLAVEYNLRHRDNVDKLILSNPGPLSLEYNEELGKIQAAVMREDFMAKRQEIISSTAFKNKDIQAYEDLFMVSFSLSFKDTTKLDMLDLNLNNTFPEGNSLLRFFTGLEAYNYYEKVGELNTPVLVVRGTYDVASKNADIRTAESFMNGELLEFENSGHFPFIEERSLYIQRIQDFLK